MNAAAIRPHASSATTGAAMVSVVRTVKKRAKKYAKHMPTTRAAGLDAAKPEDERELRRLGKRRDGQRERAQREERVAGRPGREKACAMATHT